MMTQREVERIVTLSDESFAAERAALAAAEQEAYSRYHGVSPRWPAKPGSPQMVGLGTQIGGFVGQEAWLAARDRLHDFDAARNEWVRVEADSDVAAYRNRLLSVRGPILPTACVIEVVHHGRDVSDCQTPTEAIRRVQMAAV